MGKGAGEGKEADPLQGFSLFTQAAVRFTRGQPGCKTVLPGAEVREAIWARAVHAAFLGGLDCFPEAGQENESNAN